MGSECICRAYGYKDGWHRKDCGTRTENQPSTVDPTRWLPISSAPRDATWIEVKDRNGNVAKAHFAYGGGEDQPPFGPAFFVATKGGGYTEMHPQPLQWRPL